MIALNTIKHKFEKSHYFKFEQNEELRANVSVLPEIVQRLRQAESSALRATFRSYGIIALYKLTRTKLLYCTIIANIRLRTWELQHLNSSIDIALHSMEHNLSQDLYFQSRQLTQIKRYAKRRECWTKHELQIKLY